MCIYTHVLHSGEACSWPRSNATQGLNLAPRRRGGLAGAGAADACRRARQEEGGVGGVRRVWTLLRADHITSSHMDSRGLKPDTHAIVIFNHRLGKLDPRSEESLSWRGAGSIGGGGGGVGGQVGPGAPVAPSYLPPSLIKAPHPTSTCAFKQSTTSPF